MFSPDASSPLVWFQLLIRHTSLPSDEFESNWSTFLSARSWSDSTFRIVQNFPREGNLEGDAFAGCPYDGIGEFWQGEPPSKDLDPPAWPEREDSAASALVERRNSVRIPTRVNVVMRGEHQDGKQPVKSLFFVRRKPGMSVSDFQDYWSTKHAPLVQRTPGLDRYVQFHVHPDSYSTGDEPPYDGVGELCWPDRETFRSSWSSQEIQEEQFRDTPNFLRTGEVISAIVETNILFDRQTGNDQLRGTQEQ